MKKYLEDVKRKLEWYPTLTILLAFLITVFFILQPENAVYKYGLSLRIVLEEPWRLFTCHFIHLSETHYLMNVLGIILIGSLLEYTGTLRKHILLGIVTAILTTDAAILIVQTIQMSIVGGFSGVIYGFVGMMVSVVGWRGMVALGALFFGFGLLMLEQNIAWSAHVGGFIGGLIVGKIIEK